MFVVGGKRVVVFRRIEACLLEMIQALPIESESGVDGPFRCHAVSRFIAMRGRARRATAIQGVQRVFLDDKCTTREKKKNKTKKISVKTWPARRVYKYLQNIHARAAAAADEG